MKLRRPPLERQKTWLEYTKTLVREFYLLVLGSIKKFRRVEVALVTIWLVITVNGSSNPNKLLKDIPLNIVSNAKHGGKQKWRCSRLHLHF